jgi:hypothetical protein
MAVIRRSRSQRRPAFAARRWHWPGGEPIEMRERRHRFFPKVFVSRGHRYDVYAVERCWTEQQGQRGERRCFRVRCPEGKFDVYQDVRHDTWHLQRQIGQSRRRER